MQTWEASTTQLPLSNYISDLLSSTYLNGLVTYTGSNDNVNLNEHYIKANTFEIYDNLARFIRGDLSGWADLDNNDAVLEAPDGKLSQRPPLHPPIR